ncbi:hypothetical protein CRENBAI_012432 [Crenichthys baileyi]|uniref:C2H2-type domain-containing protein n=1 Tax=Crenichthys baileyi TaxID=28760 RepID=A0AAV9SEP6_9TELE
MKIHSKASFQRSNSHDKVRKIVAEEGRAARNLIAWSVPLENKEEEAKSKGCTSGCSKSQRANSGQQKNKKQNAGVESKNTSGTVLDKGPDKSPTKARQPRKVDLRARYWAFLFDNLRRAVDEIYVTCESDQSVLECKDNLTNQCSSAMLNMVPVKATRPLQTPVPQSGLGVTATARLPVEVLMMLDNYVRDFKALIDWIQLQEKLEKTDAQNRPTSLAWEVRKMSPGRHVMPSPTADRIVPPSGARRTLSFGGPPPTLAGARLSHTGPSWADRVKCTQASHSSSQPTTSPAEKPSKKDAEGWETVQRGRTAKPRSASMVAKVSPALAHVPAKDSAKCNRSHLPEKQQLRPECPPDKDVTQTDSGQQVTVKPVPVEELEHPQNGHIMEPPAEPVQHSEQFADAPCEDVPPPVASLLPSQASECPQSKATVPPTDIITVSIPVCAQTITASVDLHQTNWLSNLLAFGDAGAEGGASQGMTTSAPGQADAPMAAVKLESVLDPTELSTPQSMAEVLAKKEELADRLEKANEEAIASAIAEEEQLTREIQAENNDLETDNESDFTASSCGGYGANIDWNDVLADFDARESWRQSTSWGDIVEEEPARPPGHGIHMHEKLSSPSRKRTLAESKKKHEEKQLKAQQLRDKLREEKTLKLQKLMEREKDVRKWKEQLLDQRRKMMEEKLLHAEFKREVQLQAIVKKAQEEEAKVNEIAFINTLEAQNKRHDALAKLNEYEQRLNELQEERQRRQEEKQARDEAVQERKRVLEAERQARVEELLTRRKEQEARIEQQRQEKEKAREDAARERARDREERLAALSAAQQEAMEELQKKIQMKHDESSRRHMEQMEQRKEKAAELSSGRHANTDYAPKLTPYERKKQCSLCGVVITSEVHLFSHTKGKRHQQAVRDSSSIQGRELSDEEVEHLSLKKYIVDILTDSSVSSESVKDGEERQKARKKAKKLRARMNSRAKEYETSVEAKNQVPDSPYKAKLQRLVKDLLKQLQGQDSGQWANNKASGLDRTLGEISRILEKKVHEQVNHTNI